jgi:hypothetical protein
MKNEASPVSAGIKIKSVKIIVYPYVVPFCQALRLIWSAEAVLPRRNFFVKAGASALSPAKFISPP